MSIYESIGGSTAVEAAVEKFYTRLTSDPEIAVFFERADMDELATRQRMFLTAALGGPDAYEGRDMRAAHAHLQITDADFDLFLDCLAASLADLGATPARCDEVLEALEPLRLEIVHASSEGADDLGSCDPPGGSG
jgi:hemoglobin